MNGYNFTKSENDSSVSKFILGIDFGTTNSQACYIKNDREVLIESFDGTTVSGKAYPSVVAYKEGGTILVGKPALDLLRVKNLTGVSIISKIKKLIKYSLIELRKQMDNNPRFSDNNPIPLDTEGKLLEPISVAAEILKKIKKEAIMQSGIEFTEAVITVPAYYSDLERENTRLAAEIAGLKVVRLINEPTAAAIAYGFQDRKAQSKLIIFDLGGGTFDVTLVEVDNGIIDVVGSRGEENTGGTNMTDLITEYFVKTWQKEHNIILDNKKTIDYLKNEVEQLKINLTYQYEAELIIPDLVTDSEGKFIPLVCTLSRVELKNIIQPVLSKIKKCFSSLITEFKLPANSEVVLVGGPTRAEFIDELIKECLPEAVINKRIQPMTCVAVGAAIQGSILSGSEKGMILVDVAPISLGVETLGGVFEKIIEKDTTIPCKRSKEFTNPEDNTEQIDIRILRGERARSSDNEELGVLTLRGLPRMKEAEARIEVTLEVNADGRTSASAMEKKSGIQAKTELKIKGQLSKEDIARIVEDGRVNEEFDRKFRELAELKIQGKKIEVVLTELSEKVKAVQGAQDMVTECTELRQILSKALAQSTPSPCELKSTFKEINTRVEAIQKKYSEKYNTTQVNPAEQNSDVSESSDSEEVSDSVQDSEEVSGEVE